MQCRTPGRILLVEDDSLIRMTLAEALEDAGFEVTQAANGEAAAALIERLGFDLLLTDVQMPGRLDGIDLARRTRRSHPDLPIVFMTGRPDAIDAIGRLGSQEAFLRKPFGPREMLATLRPLLDGRFPGNPAGHAPA
ncbi:MAG: response regulator [Acidisphaera sp.]|nr:response regulator [Acidisphaera sp.]